MTRCFDTLTDTARLPVQRVQSRALRVLLAFSALAAACSGVSSMENKLVGEWQSNGPEAVHLAIAKEGTDEEGYHRGLSYTRGGPTYNAYWAITNDARGALLWISSGSMLSNPPAGMRHANAIRHRIVELTSERLVVEWVPMWDGTRGTLTFLRPKGVEGRISHFDCGDNCYLTITDEQGKEYTGLCLAAICNEWNGAAAMPDRFKAEKVRVVIGKGTQYDGEGKVMGTHDAFTTIQLLK